MHLFFIRLFVPRTSQISPDPTRKLTFAAFSCSFLNENVLGREDIMKKRLFAVLFTVPLVLASCGKEESLKSDDRKTDGGDYTLSEYEGSTDKLISSSDGAGAADCSGEILPPSIKEHAGEPEILPEEPEQTSLIPSIEPAAGLLTAGEWCDNQNWGFLVNLVQNGYFDFYTFGIAPYQRVVVHVTSAGNPVKQARTILYDTDGNEITAAVTDYSGTAYLYYNIFSTTSERAEADYVAVEDGSGQTITAELSGTEKKTVVVEPEQSDGQNIQDRANSTVSEEMLILQTEEISVELAEDKALPKQLDVMFVFDTTGSMGDELMYLQKEFADIADQVADQSTRFSVNFYRDQGDDYIVNSNEFITDISAVSALINDQYASGGGDYEEAVDLALKDAILDHKWRDEAVKLVFLILDAPPHDTPETAENLKEAVQYASKHGIRIIPIASSGVDKKTEAFLRSIAMITGGTYTFLTDDSGIGESHLEPTIGSYTVEALNKLIVRLIKQYYQ